MTFCREQADARDSRGWQQLVNRKAAEYGELHAESEAVASMMEGVLSDEAMIREFCQKNQRAGQKILQFFGDLMDEIRKLFAND